jgi:cell division protein FtsL
MAVVEAIKDGIFDGKQALSSLKLSALIVVSLVLMILALAYVWSHIHMTQMEYRIATEISKKEALLEEQRKLKLEYATLKSPRRIESIARNNLQMTYPDREQVISIK